MRTLFRFAFSAPLVLSAFVACGGDDDGAGATGGTGGTGGRPPEETGSVCETNDQCFAGVAEGTLQGDPLCITRVRDGYCTHTCESDENCCAVSGECTTDLDQVCSPFESMDAQYCFLTCESSAVEATHAADDQAYCQRYASPDFICRSSGGGSNNRKICVPGTCGVGADCASSADCATDLDCIATFHGGYCGRKDCTTNADCPADSLCTTGADGASYCFHTCSSEGDCSFCRHGEASTTCRDDAEFVEAGTTGSVCVPTP